MKRSRIILLVLLCVVTMASYAQGDPELGRFFTSKGLRAELNRSRDDYSVPHPGPIGNTETVDEYISPEVRLDGVVIRGDGSADIWLNRGNVSQQQQVKLRSNKSGSISVKLPGGKRIRLKPGQYYSPENQAVKEVYEKQPGERDSDKAEPLISDSERSAQSASLQNQKKVSGDKPKNERD